MTNGSLVKVKVLQNALLGELTENDCHEWKLKTVNPQQRSTWRSGVRSAMRAASQLPGKGPTDVDDAPAC